MRDTQPKKALSSIPITLEGIRIVLRVVHDLNASLPINVTFDSMITFGWQQSVALIVAHISTSK